jgi:hypothetical protein
VFVYIALGTVVHIVHSGLLVVKVVVIDFKFSKHLYFLLVKGRVNSI